MSVGEKFLYLLAGTGLGAAVGILFAPKSGHDMRERLSSTVTGTVENISHKVLDSEIGQQASSRFRNVVEKGKNVANIGRQRVSESLESGKQRLNESIEAGKSEYQRSRDRDIASH